HRVLRRPVGPAGGDHRDLAEGDRADLRGPPDPQRDALRLLEGPQSDRDHAAADLHRPDPRGRRTGARRIRGLRPRQAVPGRGRGDEAGLGGVHPGVSDGLCKRSGPSTGRLVLARGRGPIRMTDQKPASESKSTRVPEALGTGLDAEIDRIIERAQAEGLQLTGKEGLLGGMIKKAVESAMNAEMTAHLGYEKYAAEGRGSGNSRNGTTTSTVHTNAGPIELDKPRDRNGEFDSMVVPKGTRRLGEFEDMVLSLY